MVAIRVEGEGAGRRLGPLQGTIRGLLLHFWDAPPPGGVPVSVREWQ